MIVGHLHLESVLLQVVRLPEPDILDVLGQAAAAIVSVVKHHSLQVTVQDVDSERKGNSTSVTDEQADFGGKQRLHTHDISPENGLTHPLARSSIPQNSSTSCLQGLGTFLQPTSSDMSPQSSSPLHCRVL